MYSRYSHSQSLDEEHCIQKQLDTPSANKHSSGNSLHSALITPRTVRPNLHSPRRVSSGLRRLEPLPDTQSVPLPALLEDEDLQSISNRTAGVWMARAVRIGLDTL